MQKFSAPGLVVLAKPGQLILLEGDTTREIISTEWLQAMAAAVATALSAAATASHTPTAAAATAPELHNIQQQVSIQPSVAVAGDLPVVHFPLCAAQYAKLLLRIQGASDPRGCWHFMGERGCCDHAKRNIKWSWSPGVVSPGVYSLRHVLYRYHTGKVLKRKAYFGQSCMDRTCVNPAHNHLATEKKGLLHRRHKPSHTREFLLNILLAGPLPLPFIRAQAAALDTPINIKSVYRTAHTPGVVHTKVDGVPTWRLPDSRATLATPLQPPTVRNLDRIPHTCAYEGCPQELPRKQQRWCDQHRKVGTAQTLRATNQAKEQRELRHIVEGGHNAPTSDPAPIFVGE